MDDKNKTPEDEAANNDIESPVDGPTPDWMRLATSASGSGSSLTDENTPAWLKSIRAGQSMSSKEEPAQAAESASAASSDVSDSDNEMSDLERLLAEEGIDLGTVAEERPEGAADMSARDWLIATSSEEIIRNKLGTHPEDEPAAPTPSAAAGDDDKMVVAEDLPDWLQEMASDSAEAEPPFAFEDIPSSSPPAAVEDDLLVVEDELPDWLQEMADEPPAAPAVSAVPTNSTSHGEDKMVVEDGLPDWLQEMADESSEGDLSLPDFDQTQAIPAATISPTSFDEDKMVVEDDLPDWLREETDEPSTPVAAPTSAGFTANQAAPPPPDDDKMVVAEDLPDWLREMADEPDVVISEAVEPPASSPVERTSPSLAGEDKMVVAEDLPDWLQEIADEPPLDTEPEPNLADFETTKMSSATASTFIDDDKMVADEDLPDWLRETGDESEPEEPLPSFSAAAGGDKMVVADDLPDWLREIEVDNAEPELTALGADLETVSADLDDMESDDDLPDWLREVETSSLEENLFAPSAETSAQESAEAPPAFPSMPSELDELDFPDDDEDLPDWLREVQERDGTEIADTALPSFQTALGTESAGAELPSDEGLPDWLKEVQEEPTTSISEEVELASEIEQADDVVIEEDLPDWLREEAFDTDEVFEPSEPSPEPLVEAAVTEEILVGEELPDWLREVPEELSEEAAFEASLPTSVPTAEPVSMSADDLIDEEGLPDWLQEATEEEAETLFAHEDLPAPEPIPAVSEEAVQEIISPVPIAAVIEAEEAEAPAVVEPEPVAVSEPTTPASSGGAIPDWLQKLREVDEEAPVPVPVMPVPVPAAAVVTKPAPQPVYAQSLVAPPPDVPADAQERLNLARTARDKGDINEAVRIYDSLVVNGVYLDKIIEDVQQAIKVHPSNYVLFQLMGDAMMRDGRLQSALNAYREALSKLS